MLMNVLTWDKRNLKKLGQLWSSNLLANSEPASLKNMTLSCSLRTIFLSKNKFTSLDKFQHVCTSPSTFEQVSTCLVKSGPVISVAKTLRKVGAFEKWPGAFFFWARENLRFFHLLGAF